MRPHILLVEDNQDDIGLIERSLRRLGHGGGLHVAKTVGQAVDYLKRSSIQGSCPPPDFILLGLGLGRGSGLEALRTVRSMDRLRAVPAIMLSGADVNGLVEEAYRLGANSCLVKPQAFEQWVEVMRAVCEYWTVHNESGTF